MISPEELSNALLHELTLDNAIELLNASLNGLKASQLEQRCRLEIPSPLPSPPPPISPPQTPHGSASGVRTPAIMSPSAIRIAPRLQPAPEPPEAHQRPLVRPGPDNLSQMSSEAAVAPPTPFSRASSFHVVGAPQGRAEMVQETIEEKLDKVKAMTMHDMIEVIASGKSSQKKLLFLTGKQADLLAKNERGALQKLLTEFEVGQPQLVINLLESGGFGEWVRQRSPESWKSLNPRWAPGVCGEAPFESPRDERNAEYLIDLFMSDVLIPLAEETHAVVICCAIPTQCILSASFTRMVQAVQSKWAHKPPFTVLSTTNDLLALYSNGKYASPKEANQVPLPLDQRYKNTAWNDVMMYSKVWSERHAEIAEGLDRMTNTPLQFDLDANAMCYIIVHDPKAGDAFGKLINSLTRHLAVRLPSLAVKTGYTRKRALGHKEPSTLEMAADSANSGTPTVFLDVCLALSRTCHERPPEVRHAAR